MTADVQEMPRSEGLRAWAIVLEVLVGMGLLCLFVLALAWDPIDRRIGARGKRIAARATQRGTGADGTDGDAYAILPAE
jgi:hypothetical protein